MSDRSPAKRYAPRWREYVIYAFLLIIEIFMDDDGVADYGMKGPWCKTCNRFWPDGQKPRKGMHCRCGAVDPIALNAWQAERDFSNLHGAFGFNDLFFQMAAEMLLGRVPPTRVSWWRAFGLDARPSIEEEARRAYKRALGDAHPDRGGSREQMDKVRQAWRLAENDYARERVRSTRP